MRALVHRILVAGSVAVLFGGVWLLWESRPQLATLGRGGAERLLGFGVWVGGLLLAAGLLFRVLARDRRQTAGSFPIRNLRKREARRRRGPAGGYTDRAFPLIPKAGSVSAADAHRDVGAAEPPPAPVDELAPPAPTSPAAKAVISLLGSPSVAVARKRGRGLRGATRELLCYLALRPGGAHRDQIIDALWPEQTPEQARNRLWRAAADARAQLGESSLRRDGERYQLNRKEVSVDVDRLEQLLAELGRSEDVNVQLPLLEQTLALFSGEPLVGSDFRWAENEQRRLHAIRLDLFERSGRALLASGDAAGALSRAEEGLGSEPYNERLARLAMQAEAALGLRAAVMRRYERLGQILDEQLGLQPHVETRRLYRHLLGQDHEHDPLPATRA
jgi:DNA-binding SARP family transcriptional activator